MDQNQRDGGDGDLASIPAVTTRGSLTTVEWQSLTGVTHRVGGPAVTEHVNGKPIGLWWMEFNQVHRVLGPAYYNFDDGSIYAVSWLQRGDTHHAGGPAQAWADGQAAWHVNNRLVAELDSHPPSMP